MEMKTIFKVFCSSLLILVCSCTNSDSNTPSPSYHSEISLDDDYNVTDFGRSGESTPDDNYYYNGTVTLYSVDGDSHTFDCYEGKAGMERGCRGVIYGGTFYNLDRNDYVTIAGTKYRTSGLLD